MAVLKHIASKNADYRAAFDYLVYQHDEFTQKPMLDEQGRRMLRQEYYLDGLLCHPLEFARVCNKTNERYHKNQKKNEIKSHHYILSFDPRDREENGLTGEEAQRMGLQFAAENFPGHQALVCTHTDGHNGSGNIHVHIVINSVRAADVERKEFMERPCDSRAGNKHHLTNSYLKYLKQQVMTMCQNRQLYQVDLLNPALEKVTEQEYWAGRRGQENLDRRNEEIRQDGLTPRTTKFETQKEFLRKAIRDCAAKCGSVEEFQKMLLDEYGISIRDKRGRFSYTHPDREKAVTGRMLGAAFEKEYLVDIFEKNNKTKNDRTKADTKKDTERQPDVSADSTASGTPAAEQHSQKTKPQIYTTTKVRLIVDLENCIKAQQSRAYAQKVKITNLKQMAQTLAYVQEHGYADVEELEKALSDAKAQTSDARRSLKETEAALSDVNKKIRLTGQYLGNKAVYAEYRKAKKSGDFYEQHRAELSLYESARDQLRAMYGKQKMPSMKSLKEEKDSLISLKNAQYEAYQTSRTQQRELQTVVSNVRQMLGLNQERAAAQEKIKSIN